MMRRLIASLALVAALAGGSAALAAPSKPASKPAPSCFYPNDVTNFAAQDDHTVNVRVGVRDVYQLVLFGSNPDIDWAQRIAVRSTAGSTICAGLDATVIAPTPIGPQSYPVKTVRKLTPDEVKALPGRAQP
jgi:hypothetical protein